MLEAIGHDRFFMLHPYFWQNFALAPANEPMRAALEKLDRITAQLELLPEPEALEKLQIEYTVLFLGPGAPKAPPWESMYRAEDGLLFGPQALQVREVMAQFGVEVAKKYSQPEDHLGLELMLLALAAEKDAQSPGGEWRASAALQANFIKAHPLGWIEQLLRDAEAYGGTGFYAALVQLIYGVLLWDRELLEECAAVQPEEM